MTRGVWQLLRRFLGGRGNKGSGDTVPVALVLGLRDAAYGLATVEREIQEAEQARPAEDLTQARLFAVVARLLKRCADSLAEGVPEEGGAVERWRSDGAATLYRAILDFMERAQESIASPPQDIRPVGVSSPLARVGVPRETPAAELLELGRRLQDDYEAELAFARARRGAVDGRCLDELVVHLRSRVNLAESLLGRGLADREGPEEQGPGRAAFDEVLLTWILIVQELVHANVTAGLRAGPGSTASGKYAPDNVWMMTDPVAKAHYERQGRLDDLEQDIRFSVLRGQPFSTEDIAYAQQIDWLEQTGVVKRMASYWAVSPHPTIYRALESGRLSVGGKTQRFRRGDQIVWLCQMGTERWAAEAPVLIGDFDAAPVRRLCSDMSNAIMAARAERGRTK